MASFKRRRSVELPPGLGYAWTRNVPESNKFVTGAIWVLTEGSALDSCPELELLV